jgi:hypothetical protein
MFLLQLSSRAQDGTLLIGDRCPRPKLFPSPCFVPQLLIGSNFSTSELSFTQALCTFNEASAIVFFIASLFYPPPLAGPFPERLRGGNISSLVPISSMLLALISDTSSTSSTMELFRSMLLLFNKPSSFINIAMDGVPLTCSSSSSRKVYSSSGSHARSRINPDPKIAIIPAIRIQITMLFDLFFGHRI